MSIKKKLGFVAVFAVAAAANVGLIAHSFIAEADTTPVVGEEIRLDAEQLFTHQQDTFASTAKWDATYEPTLTDSDFCVKTFNDDFYQAVYEDAENETYLTVTATKDTPLVIGETKEPMSWEFCTDAPVLTPVTMPEAEDMQPWFVQLIFPKDEAPAV